MLKDHDRIFCAIHIAGRKYRVRFSLNALRCLEEYKPLSEILKTPYRKWSIDDVLHLAHASMCCLPKNFKAVNRRDFDNVHPTVQELGELVEAQDLPLLRRELIEAIAESLPKNTGAENADKPKRAMHEGHQKAMFVDVIGRSEREYWSSTEREVAEVIDCYMEVNGMKETPLVAKRFADE